MSADSSALELRGATKTYGRTHALRGVDLRISTGEFLTLLGPSGSGKTTALMLWAGFVEPTSGKVLIGNRDVSHVPPHRRGLGMVFQHYALFPHMNVRQNVAFPLVMAKWSRRRIDARVDDLLELVGLAGLERRFPRQLSGGQQQRVALARALAAKSPVVLMDEPLGALDRKLREELQEEFRRIHRETETTFVYVTHDQGEALSLSDRIAVMRDGSLEQVGSPEELYEHPRTAFVAGFFGEATFLNGRAGARIGDLTVLETDTGSSVRIAARGIEAGQNVNIAIRPERFRLLAAGEPDEGLNVHAARVADRSYGGAVVRLRLETERGERLAASLQPEHAHALALGDSVRVAWRPGDERVIAP